MQKDAHVGTERVAAFSDGVIAIIITIMVLELKLPEHLTDHSIWSGILQPLSLKLVAYTLSFLVVAIMWANHHELLRNAGHASRSLIWANSHLLFWMSLIPVATHLLGDGLRYPGPVAIYGFVLLASSLGFALLRWVIARQAEGSDTALQSHHREVLARTWIGVALYAAAVPLAYVSVWIALAIFLLVPAMFFLPALVRR